MSTGRESDSQQQLAKDSANPSDCQSEKGPNPKVIQSAAEHVPVEKTGQFGARGKGVREKRSTQHSV
jgi:hypothetical protein